MNVAEQQPKLSKPLKGVYRVCEVNTVYECGWIFVSNEVDIDEAIRTQEEFEKRCPHLNYSIVAV